MKLISVNLSCGAEESTYNPPKAGEPALFRIGNATVVAANEAFETARTLLRMSNIQKNHLQSGALMSPKQLNPLTRAVLMAKHAWAVFRANNTPRYVKLILALGLAYIVSPWDLIPEWLPMIGVLDDFALAALLISWAGGFKADQEG